MKNVNFSVATLIILTALLAGHARSQKSSEAKPEQTQETGKQRHAIVTFVSKNTFEITHRYNGFKFGDHVVIVRRTPKGAFLQAKGTIKDVGRDVTYGAITEPWSIRDGVDTIESEAYVTNRIDSEYSFDRAKF